MMNTEFDLLVEALTSKILSTKTNVGRQAIATTRGQQIEKAAMIMLESHPNVESIEEQVFNDDVDEFSNIDIVINTKDGRRVYVPCARDLWLGTSQQDRLQIVWAKFGSGVFDRHDVCYLCLNLLLLLQLIRRWGRRGPPYSRVHPPRLRLHAASPSRSQSPTPH